MTVATSELSPPVEAIMVYSRELKEQHGDQYLCAVDPAMAKTLIDSMTSDDWFEHSGRSMKYGASKNPTPEQHEELFAVEGLLRVVGS